MITITRKVYKHDRCCSCFSEKKLHEIKIKYADTNCGYSFALCDNCIQDFINKYQNTLEVEE